MQGCIQHPRTDVGQGLAQGHHRPLVRQRGGGHGQGADRGFRGAVVVEHRALRCQGRDPADQRRRAGLAAQHQALARQATGWLFAAHQRLQMRGDYLQHIDAVAVQVGTESVGVQPGIQVDHVQAAAGAQGAEQRGVAKIRGNGRDHGHAACAPQRQALDDRLHIVGQGPVGDAHAFGGTGGTGGVDRIGQVPGSNPGQGCQRVTGRLPGLCLIQQQHLDPGRQRQPRLHRRLAQQQAHATVFKHVAQALFGVLRIQRHVGAAGFEHCQQAHHHLQGTLDGDTHRHLRAHAARHQRRGQTAGTLVQLAVAQALPGEYQGRRLRLRGDLAGKEFKDRFGTEHLRGANPLGQDALVLLGTEQRQFGKRRLRLAHHCPQQVLPVAGHALDGLRFEQLAVVGERGLQLAATLEGVQGQIELHRALVARQGLHFQAGAAAQGGQFGDLGLVVVQHLEQRAVVQAALQVQGFHQALEGQVLMGLGAQGGLADIGQQLLHRQLRAQLGAQHLSVDEEADQPLGFLARAVGDGHADPDVLLAAVAR